MIGNASWVIALSACATVTVAQEFPLWERLLSHYSANTDETPVPSMKMGRHMQMSLKGDSAPADAARASQVLAAASEVLARYRNVETAVRDGYKPFFPTGRVGEEIHYTNYRYRRQEQQHVDYTRPGSILYKRTAVGLEAVGVMYTAPADASPEQLNAIAPLSVATWHRHVDFCGGPRTLPASDQFGPEARFGPQGSIHTEEECRAANGLWIPVVFNWMTHVYPNDREKWGGMDMDMEAGGPEAGEDPMRFTLPRLVIGIVALFLLSELACLFQRYLWPRIHPMNESELPPIGPIQPVYRSEFESVITSLSHATDGGYCEGV